MLVVVAMTKSHPSSSSVTFSWWGGVVDPARRHVPHLQLETTISTAISAAIVDIESWLPLAKWFVFLDVVVETGPIICYRRCE
jgi:hypothetical protein